MTASPEPCARTPPGLLLHQKAEDGNEKLLRGLAGHLPPPVGIDDWHWATSLNQARAVAFGVEHFRSLMPSCMGAVVWQLNDCWPVTSWAAVDGDGRRKPLWYSLRHSFRDRILTVQPRESGLQLFAVNDSGTPWTGTAQVTRRAGDGSVLASASVAIDVGPRSVQALALPPAIVEPADLAQELVLAELGPDRAWWFFAEDIAADRPVPDLDTEVTLTEDGYRVRVTSRAVVRDLALLADRVAPDAVVDDMLVTLLPGESATFAVHTETTLDADELTGPLVLRSANQLLARPRAGENLS